MTGRELIIYILSNNLENAKVFEDDAFLENLFMSEQEAASKFRVGVATVKGWVDDGILKGVCYGSSYFIPKDSELQFDVWLSQLCKGYWLSQL